MLCCIYTAKTYLFDTGDSVQSIQYKDSLTDEIVHVLKTYNLHNVSCMHL